MAQKTGCYICAALTSKSVAVMLEEAQTAKANGADVIEIRLDHIENFNPEVDLPILISSRVLPAIVTYRPNWEGGEYGGDEESRVNVLRRAIELGVEFVDIELQVADAFIRSRPRAASETRIIVSNHNYRETPSFEELADLVARIQSTGADIVKFATTANDITDTAAIFQILSRVQVPIIALVMGPRGQISRYLAPKFGGFLTFGSLGSGRESAPGQPTVGELSKVYQISRISPLTKVFGLIGNPVGHSKSPILHNRCFLEAGVDAVYVPFLVDNVRKFLDTFDSQDFAGFSVTIPHKVAALEACDEVHPLAKSIGAVNTLIRRPGDGKLIGYNTDVAAIDAIEVGLIEREGGSGSGTATGSSPLQGRLVVVVGAGGAGRALAFAAKSKGAAVLVANRNHARAAELAESAGGLAIPLKDLQNRSEVERLAALAGATDLKVLQPVLANSTSVGMQPNVDETPVPQAALSGYAVVFDAVYTPMETRLLREAALEGATIVSGVEMFVGQAAQQFKLFTGLDASRDLMKRVTLESSKK